MVPVVVSSLQNWMFGLVSSVELPSPFFYYYWYSAGPGLGRLPAETYVLTKTLTHSDRGLLELPLVPLEISLRFPAKHSS